MRKTLIAGYLKGAKWREVIEVCRNLLDIVDSQWSLGYAKNSRRLASSLLCVPVQGRSGERVVDPPGRLVWGVSEVLERFYWQFIGVVLREIVERRGGRRGVPKAPTRPEIL